MRNCFRILSVVFGLEFLTLAQVPTNWMVNPPDFEHVMTVTVILKVNNQIAAESNNIIAAFVGGECRGVDTSIAVNGQQMYFLMVYGNTNGEIVTFKTYYSPLDTVLNNIGSLLFDGSTAHGTPDNPYEFIANYTVVEITPENIPNEKTFSLCQNFPNPFNSSTTIRYEISQPGNVVLSIFDLQGNCIEELLNNYRDAGTNNFHWQTENLSSGIYIIRLQVYGQLLQRRCIYIK